MSTVISAFIVTPFRRAGVINGAPTFTLYGLRRGSTCVVAGFPVVRVAVFAVRRSVGAPLYDARRPTGRNHRRTGCCGDVYGHFGVYRYAVPACGRHKWRPYVYALRSSSWFDMRRGRFSRRPCGSFRCPPQCRDAISDARRPAGRSAACVGWNDGFSCRSDRKFCRDDRIFCQGDRFFCRRRERQNRTVCDFPHAVGRVQWTACPSCRARRAFQGIHVSTPSSG